MKIEYKKYLDKKLKEEKRKEKIYSWVVILTFTLMFHAVTITGILMKDWTLTIIGFVFGHILMSGYYFSCFGPSFRIFNWNYNTFIGGTNRNNVKKW